jgi:uncharacterized repeat protein (TIGR03803 family)
MPQTTGAQDDRTVNKEISVDQGEHNEDLREGRLRYFETYAFPLFSHIDLRVSDPDAVRPFYDALMALFGTDPTTPRVVRYGYTRRYGSIRADFFNIFADPDARPTATRIAFAAPSTALVDEVASVVRAPTRRSTQFSSKTHWAIASKSAITEWTSGTSGKPGEPRYQQTERRRALENHKSMNISQAARGAYFGGVLLASLAGCAGVQPLAGTAPTASYHQKGAVEPAVHGFVEHLVYSFMGGNDGQYPAPEDAPLTAVNTVLYGTTGSGGISGCAAYGCGVVFSVTAASSGASEKVLYRFTGQPDGGNPSGPIIHYKGAWYGLANSGGADNYGAVFALTDAGKERVVYSFKDGADGAYPFGGLVAYQGKLYGTTSYGGSHNVGTVFSVTPNGSEHVLHSFEFKNGAAPYAGLTLMNGKFYGTTIDGGADGYGTVFEFAPSGSEKVVYSFQYGDDGASPQAPLTAIAGNLYGTTTDGGGSGYNGTAFEVNLTGTEQILHRFALSATDGYFPESTLLYHNGRLYGTTYVGGRRGLGIVFRLNMSGSEEVLHSFQGAPNDGRYPTGGLSVVGTDLYGTAYAGGSGDCAYEEGCGIVFALKPG